MPQLIPRQQAEVDRGGAVEVVALAGAHGARHTLFMLYFEEAKLLVSPEHAKHLVDQKQARYAAAR